MSRTIVSHRSNPRKLTTSGGFPREVTHGIIFGMGGGQSYMVTLFITSLKSSTTQSPATAAAALEAFLEPGLSLLVEPVFLLTSSRSKVNIHDMKPLSKIETFFWNNFWAFYLPFLGVALWVQRLPTTTPGESLVAVPWSILVIMLLLIHKSGRAIEDLRQQLAQKSTALEAATWAICNSHKEDDVKS
jgi:hypothetical protein